MIIIFRINQIKIILYIILLHLISILDIINTDYMINKYYSCLNL